MVFYLKLNDFIFYDFKENLMIMNLSLLFVFLNIALQVAWALNCADGSNSSTCNTCTNGVCVCPALQRNGMPCSKDSDVYLSIYIFF